MGLSNGTNANSGPLVFLNPRSKDAEGKPVDPHFEIARVGEDKKIHNTGETAKKVSGNLRRPFFKTREYKGKPVDHVVLYIENNNPDETQETYSIDFTFRISTRALFNAILSLTDPKNIEISIYESKKGFEALSLWQNRVMVPWKYDGRKGELPEAEVIKDRKGEVVKTDFSELDEFFKTELKKWADEIFGPERAGANNTQNQAQNEQIDNDTGSEVDAPTETTTPPVRTAANVPKPGALSKATNTTPVPPKTAAKSTSTTPAKTAPKPAAKPVEPEATSEGLDQDIPF